VADRTTDGSTDRVDIDTIDIVIDIDNIGSN
jgi:hypothetical protein